MFLSILAADMVLGITDEAIEECLRRMTGDEGVTLDGDYDRNALLLMLLASVCMDYLAESDLEEGSARRRAIVDRLSKLATILAFGYRTVGSKEMTRYMKRGVVPVEDLWLLYANQSSVLEVPKRAIDNLAELAKEVLGAAMDERSWNDYASMCETAAVCLTDVASMYRSFRRSRPSVLDRADGRLDLDL
jgi:hypothetical protein